VALTRRYALMQIRTFVFVGPARSRATPRSSRRIALTAVGDRIPELDLYRRGVSRRFYRQPQTPIPWMIPE
jgi:hypothetical protein